MVCGMAKETAAQRKIRIGMLLADYDNQNRALLKLQKAVKDLKTQIKEIDPGTYGDWTLTTGTPREILDQRGAKDALTKAGIPIPMVMTDPPIVINPR
jgi:hypothetical protein